LSAAACNGVIKLQRNNSKDVLQDLLKFALKGNVRISVCGLNNLITVPMVVNPVVDW